MYPIFYLLKGDYNPQTLNPEFRKAPRLLLLVAPVGAKVALKLRVLPGFRFKVSGLGSRVHGFRHVQV